MMKHKSGVLFFDEKTYNSSLDELNRMLADARYLSEVWQSAGCLAELNKELFLKWCDSPELIYHLYDMESSKKLETFWPGASVQAKAKLFVFEPDDPGRVTRLLRSFHSPVYAQQDVFCRPEMIDFNNGMPYISDETRERIKQHCTIERTPETEKLFTDLEAFCSNYNGLVAYLENKTGHKITLSNFRGIKIDENNGISPDTAELIRELYYKNSPDYRQNVVVGVPGQMEPVKAPKVPVGFELIK